MKKVAAKLPVKGTDSLSKLLENLTILEGWLMKSGLEELEADLAGQRVRLKKPSQGAMFAAPIAMPAPAAAPAANPAAAVEANNTFKAPLVGTFYAASGPDAAPFVQVGTEVREGQVLGIIEAMKTMNQITADRAGKVTKVLVKNGQAVEFGQPLFIIA